MEMNLRKAAKLDQAIAEKITEYRSKLTTTVVINEFDDPIKQLDDAEAEFIFNMNAANFLMIVRKNIRYEIGKKNAESGINQKLTELAWYKQEISLFQNVVRYKSRGSDDYIKGVWKKMGNEEKTDRYSYAALNEDRTMPFLTKDIHEEHIKGLADLERGKSILEDQIAELNVTQKITLSDSDKNTLDLYGVIV